MESAGVVRTLAEPNLTAISGESATFIAGGEFPVPGGYSCDRPPRLYDPDFVQEIRYLAQLHTGGDDRRPDQPRVMTEVSELSNDNSITLSQSVTASDGQLGDHSLDQDAPGGNHAGNSLRRRDGHGRA
jgi:pilus assembly protein CpaC